MAVLFALLRFLSHSQLRAANFVKQANLEWETSSFRLCAGFLKQELARVLGSSGPSGPCFWSDLRAPARSQKLWRFASQGLGPAGLLRAHFLASFFFLVL